MICTGPSCTHVEHSNIEDAADAEIDRLAQMLRIESLAHDATKQIACGHAFGLGMRIGRLESALLGVLDVDDRGKRHAPECLGLLGYSCKPWCEHIVSALDDR